jgi:anthranilate synthase component II
MKLLIIDNFDCFTYNLVQIVEELAIADYSIETHDKVDIGMVSKFDKILLTPGPGLPNEHPIMKKVIRKYCSSKSIMGVCLGHQAIAETFGGELFKQITVSHGVTKKVIINNDGEYIFKGLPKEIRAGLYHSWAVSTNNFPNELKITAKSEDGIIMALAHKHYDVKGVQFHPESIMTPSGKQILSNWLAVYK